MNGAPDTATDPVAALTQEVVGFRGLLDLLRAEQEALRVADADALARIVQTKLTQVYALQDLGTARAQMLRNGGLPANRVGMRALLDQCAQPERGREQWDTLLTLAGDAERQNALNGRLTNVRQRHVDRALAALCSAAGHHSTYGADGRSRPVTTSHSMASI